MQTTQSFLKATADWLQPVLAIGCLIYVLGAQIAIVVMYPGDEMIVELFLVIVDVLALYLITIGSHQKTLQTCYTSSSPTKSSQSLQNGAQ